MGDAKRLIIKPISAKDANGIIRSLHYSGKVATTSKLHLGVFLDGKCGGAMQFGDPIDKRKLLPLVSDTPWRGFMELNRMAFADWLPRNGESRCLAMAMKFIRKNYNWVQWIVSFADGCQCGDGTIYRASGFELTNIVVNKTMWRLPSGEVIADLVTRQPWNDSTRVRLGFKVGESWKTYSQRIGAERLIGFQLRYIYFIDPTARERLTVPILPFSEIDRRGAGMYKGKPRVRSVDSDTSTVQVEESGANPTRTL
jgi:hypothetical protein